VDRVDVDALLEGLVSIHGDELLRHPRQERGVDRGELRALSGGREELVDVLRQELDVLSGAILEHEGEAPGRSHAGNRRGRKREREALRQRRELTIQALADVLVLLLLLRSLLPLLERDEEEGGVARPREAQEAESDDARRRLDARRSREHLLDLPRGGDGPLQRGRARKLEVQVDVALVLIRQEARG